MDGTPQMSKARKRRVKWDTWSELMLRILNRPDDENAADNDLSNGRWFTDMGTQIMPVRVIFSRDVGDQNVCKACQKQAETSLPPNWPNLADPSLCCWRHRINVMLSAGTYRMNTKLLLLLLLLPFQQMYHSFTFPSLERDRRSPLSLSTGECEAVIHLLTRQQKQ